MANVTVTKIKKELRTQIAPKERTDLTDKLIEVMKNIEDRKMLAGEAQVTTDERHVPEQPKADEPKSKGNGKVASKGGKK